MVLQDLVVLILSTLLHCLGRICVFPRRLNPHALQLVSPRADLALKRLNRYKNGFEFRDQSIHFAFTKAFRGIHLLRFFLSVLFCQALWACESKSQPSPPSQSQKEPGPAPQEFILKGVTVERFVHDKRQSQARAVRAVVNRRSGQIQAQQVQILSQTVEAYSDRAQGNLNQDLVLFQGNVRVTDESGRTIKTESARFDAAQNRLSAKTTVRIEGANFNAVGQSLDANFKTKEIKIAGPISARVKN
jgi:LPS export ABC transporter protein LptC